MEPFFPFFFSILLPILLGIITNLLSEFLKAKFINANGKKKELEMS